MHASISLEYPYDRLLEPSAPFNFDATFHKPDHFPSADHTWQPGCRWQTMLWQGQALGLRFQNRGSLEKPGIDLTIYAANELSEAFLDSLVKETRFRYNLDMDMDAFNRQMLADDQSKEVMQRWLGLRPMNPGSLYEYLIIAIVLQNATVRRSVNMLQTLFDHYGTPLIFDGRTLFGWWQPEALHDAPEQALRDLKVGYRAKSMKRVSETFALQRMDEFALRGKSADEQRKALLELYGVGPASVGYLMFDVFHRWDEITAISPWEQKIYSRLFFNTETDQPVAVNELMAYFTRRFAGYRMLAVHVFWEDLFWKRSHEKVEWLEALIRL